jgi:hypothetical protein
MSAAVLAAIPTRLESARHHHAQSDLLRAAQAYRETLQSYPQSQTALLGLSLPGRQSNQPQSPLHMARAALAGGSNRGEEALAAHQVAAAANPHHPGVL